MKKWKEIPYFMATGFGLGSLPKAPGTWGTLGGVLLYFILSSFSFFAYLSFVLLAFVGGCWLCEYVAKKMKVYDHASVVWDEIVGYCVAMIGVPKQWEMILAGFLLFRLFDILKPWPICQIDTHMKSGVGMMLDDALAGLFVCLILQLYKLL